MPRPRFAFSLVVVLAALSGAAAACSASSEPGLAGQDGGGFASPDAPLEDAGGSTPADADTSDAAVASAEGGDSGRDLLGTLASGACGVVAAELSLPRPSLAVNHLVFVAGETYERASLSAGGQTLFDTANAGGSSGESEVLSFEVLRYCEGATLLKTETQIAYQPPDDSGPNTITDLSVVIGGKKVGVSVTRAYRPAAWPLTDADVKELLVKKLEGIKRSSQRVLPEDKWVKQILHVLSVNDAATEAVRRAWPTIDESVRADTVVLVTETKGGGFVYCNPDPPLGSECP